MTIHVSALLLNPNRIQRKLTTASVFLGTSCCAILMLCFFMFVFFISKNVVDIYNLISIGGFWLALSLFPEMRPEMRITISPKNIALACFFLKLVVEPLTAATLGLYTGVLITLPSTEDIIWANIFNVISFLVFCLGWSVVSGRSLTFIRPISRRTIILLTIIFSTLSSLALIYNYSFSIDYALVGIDSSTSIQTTICDYLLKMFWFFIPYSIVLIFYGLTYKSIILKALHSTIGLCLASFLMLILTINPNRTSMVYPLVCLLATYSFHIKRISYKVLLIGGVALCIAVFLFGEARRMAITSHLNEGTVHFDTLPQETLADLAQNFQIHFGGPQFIAFLFQRVDGLNIEPTLLSSLLESIPVLGKQFRQTSGTSVYNFLIYQSDIARDQVFPTVGELYLNFGVIGIVLGYFLIGIGYKYIHMLFTSSIYMNPIFTFSLCAMAIYYNALIMLSFTVFSQFICFNSLPAFIILLISLKAGHFCFVKPNLDHRIK